MSSKQLRSNEEGPDRCRDLSLLLAAARTGEPGLHAFYLATAPRLAYALAATRDEKLADEVLVRTYRRVWRHIRTEMHPLSGDKAVFGWLMRIALSELASLRRASTMSTPQGSGPPGLLE